MLLCVNPACAREMSLGALFCDYCQTPGRALGWDPDPWTSGVRLVGRVLKGRFRIDAVMRVDETGLLYAVIDQRTGEDAALRLLPRKITASPDRLQALEATVRQTSNLNHVNLRV